MNAPYRVEDWAVVVPSYRNADDTIACLESLRSATPTPELVIVVDDASGDDSLSRLESWAESNAVPVTVERHSVASANGRLRPGLTILASQANEGFNATSNKGLACARDRTTAPFVLLLNNDAIVTPSFFRDLRTTSGLHPGVGLMTGTIYEWDRSTVWFAGGRIHQLRGLASNETVQRSTAQPYETDWISGCAMLIARPALERVGLLPSCFGPIYSEDVDYSLSVRRAGFQLLVVPSAIVYHRVGQAVGQPGSQPPQIVYVSNRNRAYVVRRNYRGWRRVAALGYLAVTKPLRAVFEAVRGRPRTGWAVLAGTLDGMLNPAARR
jgi:GT2 family glycosyltransferase